jgi:hypothetical protein
MNRIPLLALIFLTVGLFLFSMVQSRDLVMHEEISATMCPKVEVKWEDCETPELRQSDAP